MMLEKQTRWPIAPRTPAAHKAENDIAFTRQQILQIADALDSADEDELATARSAWIQYQSTRERDAVYQYLRAVSEIVLRLRKERRAKAKSRQALAATKSHKTIKTKEPFNVVIYCTSDPNRVDAKTRSKWSRALRYAERFKPDNQGLEQFVKSKGGINECASLWSERIG